MYDPTVGRWLSEDPLSLEPDTNPYRYVHNSPTNLTDPSGLEEEPVQPPTRKEIDDLSKRLGGGKSQQDEKPTIAETSKLPWGLSDGKTAEGKIVGVKEGMVTLEQGKTTVTIPLDKFSEEDRKLIEQLQLVPANIMIDSTNKEFVKKSSRILLLCKG